MIDLYADDLTLSDIMEHEDKYILVFANVEKDERVLLSVNNVGLLNILCRTARRCEVRDLIYPTNLKIKEETE